MHQWSAQRQEAAAAALDLPQELRNISLLRSNLYKIRKSTVICQSTCIKLANLFLFYIAENLHGGTGWEDYQIANCVFSMPLDYYSLFNILLIADKLFWLLPVIEVGHCRPGTV